MKWFLVPFLLLTNSSDVGDITSHKIRNVLLSAAACGVVGYTAYRAVASFFDPHTKFFQARRILQQILNDKVIVASLESREAFEHFLEVGNKKSKWPLVLMDVYLLKNINKLSKAHELVNDAYSHFRQQDTLRAQCEDLINKIEALASSLKTLSESLFQREGYSAQFRGYLLTTMVEIEEKVESLGNKEQTPFYLEELSELISATNESDLVQEGEAA